MSLRTILSLIGTTNTEAEIDKTVTLAAEIDGYLSILALKTAISPFGPTTRPQPP